MSVLLRVSLLLGCVPWATFAACLRRSVDSFRRYPHSLLPSCIRCCAWINNIDRGLIYKCCVSQIPSRSGARNKPGPATSQSQAMHYYSCTTTNPSDPLFDSLEILRQSVSDSQFLPINANEMFWRFTTPNHKGGIVCFRQACVTWYRVS
jgi:hypothetical protein